MIGLTNKIFHGYTGKNYIRFFFDKISVEKIEVLADIAVKKIILVGFKTKVANPGKSKVN